MVRNLTRRHQRLHEQILLSGVFSLILGWCLAIGLPALIIWSFDGLLHPNRGQRYALIAASIAYVIAIWTQHNLGRFPGARSFVEIAPQVALIFGLVTLATLMLRLDMSRLFMAVSAFTTMCWCYVDASLRARFKRPKFAITPFGSSPDLLTVPGIDARLITEPQLDNRRYDGVIADFAAIPNATWERFLAHCALSRIPVYHARQMSESLTGRVRINHISENSMGSLLPSPTYERLKYLFDVLIILATSPITVPLALVTAILIRIESPGPAIFKQERIGQGNRPFQIYKFRSMVAASEARGARFASENDSRVTRIGRVIRKLRIDEIPQFINVLKGEMSLIGPRPEQRVFVEHFDEEIPFYSYRHVVRPGITGWAQVTQGYVADTDDTRLKIEHDFYYIKHCSLSLDLLIVLRTLQTMLTGFGAR